MENHNLLSGAKSSIQKDTLFLNIYQRLFKTFGQQHWWPGESPFEIMVGAILTQNTNWQNVEKAIDNIKKAGLLNPKDLLKNRKKIPKLVRPSGFYKLKSKRLINFLKFFVGEYDGEFKKMAQEPTGILRTKLLRIEGIGPETADSILLYALKKPVFVVDAYTRRILLRHKIIKEENTYEEIQKIFEKNLPVDVQFYNEYHALIVRLGKNYCKKNEPLCDTCPISDNFK